MNFVPRDARFLVGQPSGDTPIKIICPNPQHIESTPSYAVYADGGYCFGCGYRENFDQIIHRLGVDPEHLPERTEMATRDANQRYANLNGKLDIAVKVWHRCLMEGPRQARQEWFYARGFNPASLSRFLLGHTGESFTLPLWDGDNIVGYKLRSDPVYADPEAPKYISPKGQGRTTIRPNPRGCPTVVVEGELDCYLLAQWGVDALTVSTGAGSLSDALRGTTGIIYGIPDVDDAGVAAGKALVSADPERVRLIRLPWGNDVTDFLCALEPTERGIALRRLFDARPDTTKGSTLE